MVPHHPWNGRMKINVLKYTTGWAGLLVLAILNGAIREKVYQPFMSELSAHQLSTAMGLCLFGIYIWFLTGTWRIGSAAEAFTIGGIWLVFTILFEFFFFHYAMGHPWSRLFQDYNLFKGRVWILVLLWTAIAPYVFYRFRS
jgi:hypothetical protein